MAALSRRTQRGLRLAHKALHGVAWESLGPVQKALRNHPRASGEEMAGHCLPVLFASRMLDGVPELQSGYSRCNATKEREVRSCGSSST